MPIRNFRCDKCGERIQSLKTKPRHCGQDMQQVLSAPNTKFMEPTNKERGKSNMKGQKEILMARAKEHSRQNDLHDAVQNNSVEMGKRVGWLGSDGRVRKRVDEL